MKKGSSFYGGGYNSFYGNIDSYGDINNLYEYKELGPLPIVSFNDAIKNSKIKELIVAVQPQQDLHGYANPWPAGGGVNMLSSQDGTYVEKESGNLLITQSGGMSLAAGTYYVGAYRKNNTSNSCGIYQKINGGTASRLGANSGSQYIARSFTLEEAATVELYVYSGTDTGNEFRFMLTTSVLTDNQNQFEPYSNVCPITGHTAAKVTRCGKNLWAEDYTGISATIVYKPLCVGGGSFTLSTTNPQAESGVYNLFLLAGNVNSGAASLTNGVWLNNPRTVTAMDGYVTVAYRRYANSTSPADSNTQLELGSTATSYEPYAGQVYEIKFPLLTKNLADMREENIKLGYYIATNGAETAHSSNFIYNQYIPVKANTSYTISMSSSVYFISISEYSSADRNGFIIRKAGGTGSNTKFTVTTGSSTKYIRFGSNVRGSSGEDLTMQEVLSIDWMLEEGSTASDYEPYTSTVYGGTLDAVSGVLTVDRVSVDMGTLTWEYDSQYSRFMSTSLSSVIRRGSVAREVEMLCSVYQCIADKRSLGNVPDSSIYEGGNGTVYVHDSRYTIKSDFETVISGSQLIYPIKSPATYQFTPQQIATLLGENHVWADTGNITLTYKAKK